MEEVDDCERQMCLCFIVEVCMHKIFALLKWFGKKVCMWDNWVSVLVCVTVSVVLYPCWQSSSYHSTNPERVARVGAMPDCRQAHYLSLAKKKKKKHHLLVTQKTHTQNERAFICCLTLREFPLLFT